MTGIVVRPFTVADHAAVAALTLTTYEAGGRQLSDEYRDFLADVTARHRASSGVLVAELDGVIAGAVMLMLAGDPEWEDRAEPTGDCGFRALAVAGWAQGCGVGRRLVDACVDEMRARGCRRMLIASLPWMTAAHRLYAARGFVRRPDLDVIFPEGHGMVFTLDLTADAAEHFAPPGVAPEPLPWWSDVWVPAGGLERSRDEADLSSLGGQHERGEHRDGEVDASQAPRRPPTRLRVAQRDGQRGDDQRDGGDGAGDDEGPQRGHGARVRRAPEADAETGRRVASLLDRHHRPEDDQVHGEAADHDAPSGPRRPPA